jgi:hypothetical protein
MILHCASFILLRFEDQIKLAIVQKMSNVLHNFPYCVIAIEFFDAPLITPGFL